jgi:hypothetical protein
MNCCLAFKCSAFYFQVMNMAHCFASLSLVCALPLAAFDLNQMTSEEQQKTGVSQLTPVQKKALEEWLDNHCSAQSAQNTALYLSVNIDSGKRLELSDGSIYEVAPGDTGQTSLWITPFPIRIESSTDPDYPLRLVNINSGSSVKARKLSPN